MNQSPENETVTYESPACSASPQEPTKRPYVNIYAQSAKAAAEQKRGEVRNTAGPAGPQETTKRPYVNIYAQSAKAATTTAQSRGEARYAKISDPSVSYEMAPPPNEAKPYVNIYARPKTPPAPAAVEQAAPIPEASPASPFEGGKGIPYYGAMPLKATQKSNTYQSALPADARAERLNLLSLILGIFAYTGHLLLLTCLTPFAAVLAIIFACKGRQNGAFDKKGKAGFILGLVFCAVIVVAFIMIFAAALFSDGGYVM